MQGRLTGGGSFKIRDPVPDGRDVDILAYRRGQRDGCTADELVLRQRTEDPADEVTEVDRLVQHVHAVRHELEVEVGVQIGVDRGGPARRNGSELVTPSGGPGVCHGRTTAGLGRRGVHSRDIESQSAIRLVIWQVLEEETVDLDRPL